MHMLDRALAGNYAKSFEIRRAGGSGRTHYGGTCDNCGGLPRRKGCHLG